MAKRVEKHENTPKNGCNVTPAPQQLQSSCHRPSKSCAEGQILAAFWMGLMLTSKKQIDVCWQRREASFASLHSPQGLSMVNHYTGIFSLSYEVQVNYLLGEGKQPKTNKKTMPFTRETQIGLGVKPTSHHAACTPASSILSAPVQLPDPVLHAATTSLRQSWHWSHGPSPIFQSLFLISLSPAVTTGKRKKTSVRSSRHVPQQYPAERHMHVGTRMVALPVPR